MTTTTRIWKLKKERELIPALYECSRRGPNVRVLSTEDTGSELRAIVAFQVKTLIKPPEGEVTLAGPVIAGIRYTDYFLSRAPHPMEIVQLLAPLGIYHPNCNAVGALCIAAGGRTESFSMDRILHQIFATLMFNMTIVNTRPGEILNLAAANYVRASAHRFPLSKRGLFEELEPELRAVLDPSP